MRKGLRTREAIVREAVALASTQGLTGLSIGRLADRAGLSKSGLFGHFGSKEALQHAVLEFATEEFRASVILPALREPTGRARLERLFAAWLSWTAAELRTGGCPLLGASIELDDQPGELRDYLVEKQRAWLDCIAGMALKARSEGDFRPDLDAQQLAFEVNGIGLCFNFAHRLLGDPAARERATAAFARLLADAAA